MHKKIFGDLNKLFTMLVAILVCSSPGLAADSSIKGDIEYGEYLSSECASCHKKSGASGTIPSITGWDPKDFIAVINMYRKKERSNKVMQLVASRLTDEQIASLALYFSKLPTNN